MRERPGGGLSTSPVVVPRQDMDRQSGYNLDVIDDHRAKRLTVVGCGTLITALTVIAVRGLTQRDDVVLEPNVAPTGTRAEDDATREYRILRVDLLGIISDTRRCPVEALAPDRNAKCSRADTHTRAAALIELAQVDAEFRLATERRTGVNVSREIDLSGVSLPGADLSGADLEDMVFVRANLQRANLSGVTAVAANFDAAILTGVNFERADLEGASLRGADLRRANLEGANLTDADLEGANLEYANLKSAQLGWTQLKDAKLRGVKGLTPDQMLSAKNVPGPAPAPARESLSEN